ncbi:hypothetical protein [Nocardioides sp. LML1-1-1.1]|uniref:hypothetical protein n=1 Tax=Nocardioides sp. LML1-1-1.1 TaxID=3135248 RepID=UPI0034285CD0
MAKNATSDLAHDLRDVADDLKELVETVVAPRVTSAARAAAERGSAAVHAAAERAPEVVQAAADRVPDSVVDRLPDRVTDRLPVEKSHRGRKLLLLAGLLAVGGAVFSALRRSQGGGGSHSGSAGAPGTASATPSYPRPVDEPAAAAGDPLADPAAEPPRG